MPCKWINKVGLAVVQDGKLLVVRKRGTDVFILPGGKPEGNERELETLERELEEELGCGMERPMLRAVFSDIAAGSSDAVVVVRLYTASLVGDPKPQSEIEQLAWVDLRRPSNLLLAPSIRNGILPYLRKRQRASTKSELTCENLQGLFEAV